MFIEEIESYMPDKQSFFIFDCNVIRQQAEMIAQVCEDLDIELFFAVKSCSDARFIELILPYLDGFDVSNLNELKLIKHYDKKISFFSPILASSDLGQLDLKFDSISVEDVSFRMFGSQKYYRFDLTSLYSEKTQSRFGLDLEALAICEDVEAVHVHVRELQEYNSSDFINAIKNLLLRFPKLKSLNLGGGWHKLVGQEDYKDFLSNIREAFPSLALRIEPGRFFSINSGKLKSKVMRIDINRKLIVVDISSMLHLLWCTPEINFSNIKEKVEVTIFGATCFEYDVVGKFSVDKDWLSSLKVGDSIIFTGLSTYTIQRQSAFNGIQKLNIYWENLF